MKQSIEQKTQSQNVNQRTQKENLDNSVRRMAGKTEKALIKKGNRQAIVDTQDKSHAPYFYTLIDGQEQWQLVHQDRYKLNKRIGKIGSLPISRLRIKG